MGAVELMCVKIYESFVQGVQQVEDDDASSRLIMVYVAR